MKKAGGRSVHTFTGPVAQRRNKKLLTKKKCCVPNCKNTSDTSEDLIFFLVPITLFRKEVFDAIEAGTGERPKQSSGTTYVHVCQAHYKLEEDVKFWNLCNPNTTNGGSYRIQLKAGVVPHVFPSPGATLVASSTSQSAEDTGRASEQTEGNNATFISGFEKRKLPRETAGSEDEGLYDLMETQEAASRNLVNKRRDLLDFATASTASKQPRFSLQQQTCERNQQFIPPHTSMNTDSGDGDQDTHKNVEESWKEHKCVVCDVAASPRNKLLFPCSRCNFVLDSLIALEIHLAKRHKCGKPVIEVQTYCDALKREAGTHHKCLLCKEELHFGVFEALQSHINVDHRLCNVCGMRMKSSVEEHIVEHKEQFKSIYQCTGCYFESPFQKKVLDHIRQHHKNGIYFVMESNGRLGFDCPYCHYSTSCNRVLEIHMRHHREKTCIVCDTKYIPSAKHIACDLIKVCRKCQPKSQPTNCDLWDTKSAEPTNCDPELIKPEFVSVDNIKQEPVENFTELDSETSGQFSQVQIKQEIKDDEFDLENGERNIDDSPNLNCALNRENSGQFFQVQIKEEVRDDEFIENISDFNLENGERNIEQETLPNLECVEVKTESSQENLAGNVTTEHDSELIIGSTTPDDEMDEPNHCPVCEINHGDANQCYLSSVIDDENLLKSLQTEDADVNRKIQVLEILRKFLVTKVKERRLSKFIVNQFKEVITLAIKVHKPVDEIEQCFCCGLYLSSILELYDHMMVSHKNVFSPTSLISEFKLFLKPYRKKIEMYKCLLCNIGVKSVTDLFCHISKLHNYCRLCGNSCLDHITCHEMEIIRHSYHCHICDDSLKVDLEAFQQHFMEHPPYFVIPQPNKFNCPYCQFYSTSDFVLSFHLKCHKLQFCAVCSEKFIIPTKCVAKAKANTCYKCNDFEIVRCWKYEEHLGNIANVVVIRDTNIRCFEGKSKFSGSEML